MFKDIVTDVFFDLDHTLWDFERNSALTFKTILSKHDIDIDHAEFLKIYIPTNLAFWKLYREERITQSELRYQRLKTVFDALKYRVSDETIHLLSEEYISRLTNYNYLFPYTVEILEYLRPKYRLHIITNGFQQVQRKKLKNAQIWDYFIHVVDSEMAGVKKPNPLIFELALQTAEVPPNKALMIGDNLEADILGARAVGLHTLHFNAHNAPRHEFCEMIHDLREIKFFL